MMTTKAKRRPLIQYVLIGFLIAVIGAGMWFGRDDPDTPWGPIILGAFAVLGLIIRTVFNLPTEGAGDDRYGSD